MPHLTSAITTLGLSLMLMIPGYSEDLVFKNSRSNSTLVELYSSEGCSSCPPAETWVSGLKNSPALWTDLFPVVFHVDYWDGLGWPDRFAKAAYTQRQRNYAASLRQDSVYTPEFVTGGREWKTWFDGGRQPRANSPTTGELSLRVTPDRMQVSGSYLPDSRDTNSSSYTLNVALLGVGIRSNVGAGENGGRELVHDFVVLDFKSVSLAKGQNFQSDPINLKSSTDDHPGALVAWLSTQDGTIIQVAGGYLRLPAPSTSASNEN